MNHFNKLLLAATLLPSFAFAQSNYKPGYLVTAKGDTLRGEINQKEWYGNPRSIDFKGSAGIKSYTAADINFFEILNSSAYQRYAGSISTDETNLARLSQGIDSGKKQDVVFLKTEQQGTNITLYSYTDAIKTRYFIQENSNGVINELVYRIYFLPDAGAKTREENIFIPQLNDLANRYNPGSETLKREILRATYNSSDLKDIAQKLNNMANDKRNYNSGTSVRFFAGIGINQSSIKPNGTFTYTFEDVNSKTSFYPTLSAGIDINVNPNVGKLILRAEVMVTGLSYKNVVDFYFMQPDKPNSNYALKQVLVLITPQVLYNIYNTKPFKFYVDGGINIGIVNSSGNTVYNKYVDVTTTNYLLLESSAFSFPIKLGVVLDNKIDIGVSYSFKTSITNHRNYSLDATSVKAGINYLF